MKYGLPSSFFFAYPFHIFVVNLISTKINRSASGDYYSSTRGGDVWFDDREKRKGRRRGKASPEGMESKGGQLTCSEYTIPFPKWLDVNCTLVAYLRFGVDMSVTR